MKKNMKRIVTLVLCAVMALGLLAVSASADGLTENDNVVTAKSVTDNRDGTYNVKLEAYATGTATVETEKVYQPLDIVIAMDVSDKMNTYIDVGNREENLEGRLDTAYGANENVYQLDDGGANYNAYRRMKYEGGTWYYRAWAWSRIFSGDVVDGTYSMPGSYYGMEWPPLGAAYHEGTAIRTRKIDAEKIAVQNFLKELSDRAKEAAKDNADYSVSVVQYAGSTQGTSGSAQVGTSNFVCGWTTDYNSVKGTVVQQSVFATDAGKDQWSNIPTYQTSGEDHLDQALIQAQNAFSGRSGAKKILILFSSGESANGDVAKTIATAMGDVTIYTVAIGTTNSGALSEIANGGAYSSTYANDLQDRLNDIFVQIDHQYGGGTANVELDESAVLKDIVTDYFDIVGPVTAHTESFAGGKNWTNNNDSSVVTPVGRTISVTGFDYSANWVDTAATSSYEIHGKKLVVEFKIKPRDGFLGGNHVPTNADSSAIYVGDTVVEHFTRPTVDVAIPTLTVTAEDKNVYLLGGVTADQMKDSASVTLNGSAIGTDWQDDFVTVDKSATAQSGLTDDGTYTVSCTVTPKTTGEVSAATFTSASANILVFKPVLTYSDETIYLSQSPTLTPTSTVWKHGETASTAVTMLGAAPTLSDYTYSTGDFSTCQTGVTLTGLKVGGTTVTSGFTANPFAVHVLKPTLTADDVTIYRGSSVSLSGQVSISAWACSCTGSAHKTGDGTDGPTASYDYKVAGSTQAVPEKPEDCTSVTATLKLNGTAYSAYTKDFTVHVLQPGFTVNTNDVWADYGVVVNLAANCVDYTTTPMTWKCSDSKTDATAPNVKGPAPTLSSAEFTFGTDTGSYTVGEADKDFQLTAAKFTLSNGYEQTENYTDESFTVHVNTFDLTITKSWSGADCYKQDTIFIITRANGGSYSGGETLRVVIPKDKGSVTIAGLLCGQQYQVKEDTGWSWRWEPAAESFNVSGRGAHDEISKTKLADFTKKVTFTNTLNSNKTQWLSGSDYVNNVYNNNGWSQVTAGIVNKARQALHLG